MALGVGFGVQRVVDGGLNVGALGMDQAFDLKILGIVSGVFQCLAGQFSKIRHDRCADFAGQDNVAFGCQHFAGHAGVAVKGQTPVQHRVGDLVAEFVRVAVGHGFGGIKMGHKISPFIIMLGRSRPDCAPSVRRKSPSWPDRAKADFGKMGEKTGKGSCSLERKTACLQPPV